MAEFNFNPFAEFVHFRYKCPYCHQITKSDSFAVPYPDFGADNQSDSENSDSFDNCCEHCGESINVDIYNGMYGGTVIIEDVEPNDAFDFEEEYPEEETNLAYQFYTDTYTILDDIESLSDEAKTILYRLLYANAIAYMEAFLSNTAKREAIRDKDSIKQFVENCNDFEERQLKLKDIYSRLDGLTNEISKYLDDLIYHKLYKIKGLFKDCLGIEIGDISELSKAVLLRHDIVHRNGKSKDGKECAVGRAEVEKIWHIVDDFIENINKQIKAEKVKLPEFVDAIDLNTNDLPI